MRIERSTAVSAGFVLVAVLAVWLQHVVIPYSEPYWGLFQNFLDLDVYRAGAQVALDGADLYDAKLLGQMDFTYAPVSVILFAPFAWMSAGLAHLVWTVGVFVALYLVVMLSFRSLGHEATWRLRTVALSVVAISIVLEPVRSTIWFGQINVFLMLLVVADLVRPDGSRLRGVWTGLAGGIKLTPLIFGAYLAVTRQWRAVGGVIAGFAASVAVGFAMMPSGSLDFWFRTLFESDRVSSPQTRGNQSIRGAIANTAHTDQPSTLLWIALSLLLVALAGTAAVLAHRRGQELLAISLVGMTSCAVSPVAWSHHWVWLVPLLVVAIHQVFENLRGWRRIGMVALTVGGLLLAFVWRTHYAFAMWFANRSVEEAYVTGLFFKQPAGFDWLTSQPFVMILVVAAVVTIVAYRSSLRGAVSASQTVVARR